MYYQNSYLNNNLQQINNLIKISRNNILQFSDYQPNILIKNIHIQKKYKKNNKFKRFNLKYKKLLSYIHYPFYNNYNNYNITNIQV